MADIEKFEERALAAEKQIAALQQKIAELEVKAGGSGGSTSKKPSDDARAFYQGFIEKRPDAKSTHVFASRISISDLIAEGASSIDKEVTLAGWAKTIRPQGGGRFTFVELNDGSTAKNFQVVIDKEVPGFKEVTEAHTSCSVLARGVLVKSIGQNQATELRATEVALLGECTDPDKYPLAKKRHTPEHLREVAHLRSRTNLFAASTRIRNAISYATHKYFQDNGFFYIHTPLITASDCEGAGELFTVTTLLKNNVSEVPQVKDSPLIDYSKDFFGKKAYLTVSGQLNVESFACALSKVYTFGPTFRAENSFTTKHLAEFWMIEPEISFADIIDNMNYAESFLKYCTQFVMDNCPDELAFCNQWVEKGLLDRLKNVLESPFERVTYTKAVNQLIEVQNKGHKFDLKVEHGMDLKTEHERYIVERIYKKPVILYNYPKDIKAFYMRMNEDGETVAAMDILVPKIGEVIGGSQREERLDKLEKRLDDLSLPREPYSWYLDLRRYGSVMHSGFGVGLERLVMFVSGIENIRDVIPFPRWPGHAQF